MLGLGIFCNYVDEVKVIDVIDYRNTMICITCVSSSKWSMAEPDQNMDNEQAAAESLAHNDLKCGHILERDCGAL